MRIPKGSKVTCLVATPAYYSGYGITPVCIFEPGMIGTFVHWAPSVKRENVDFAVVDYVDANGDLRRVALNKNNIKRVK